MSTTLAGLAGLVKGYTDETARQAHESLAARVASRDSMLEYLGHMATNPNVPAEHQQWALQKAAELAQADVTKKLPKVDLGELPPVMRQRPTPQQSQTIPGGVLRPPTGGPGGVGPGGGQTAPGAPSGVVGTASNGTVNAIGNLQAPIGPPTAQDLGISQTGVLPASMRAPQLIPPQGVLTQGPTPAPEQVAPGGQPHITTPEERQQTMLDAQETAINRLQQQYPERSRADLAYFAQHGVFPKDEGFTLGPGQKRFSSEGKEVASNEEAKPGAKSGFSYDRGMVKDNATGRTLSDAEVAANPEAKAVFDTGQKRDQQLADEQQKRADKAADRQDRRERMREEAAINKQVTGAAVDASKKAKAMIDVLDTSEDYMRRGDFSPRQDLALVVRAVRAMNPGSVRLPQKELDLEIKAGSYGDRFKRWYETSTSGLLPPDQRQDLMRTIREETEHTGKSAAENWQQAFQGSKPVPSYLKRFTLQEPRQPAPIGGGEGGDLQKFLAKHGVKQ